MSIKIAGQLICEAERETAEAIVEMLEGYTQGQIRMAAGEMTAQEMRSILAVRRWWCSAIRHKFVDGQSEESK